jgi:hypothetical protein
MLGMDGHLVIKSSLLDFLKEDSIELIEWLEASQWLVVAISKHLFMQGDPAPGGSAAKAIAKMFQHHFSTIQERADFKSDFASYWEYDITIHRKYLHELHMFNLAIFQKPHVLSPLTAREVALLFAWLYQYHQPF